MNSNYMFAFNRRQMGPPAPSAGSLDAGSLDAGSLDAGSLGPAPSARSLDAGSLGPAPSARSLDARSLGPNGPGDRFSINRLINHKSAGGCRSCN